MRAIVLGCGSSPGVPLIGCQCRVCRSPDPRNRRRRVSLLVEKGASRVLVDTSPDLRLQLLDAAVTWVSGVVYTHGHADHVHGIDELRSLNYHMNRSIDVYGRPETLDTIQRRFGYAFDAPGRFWSRPSLVGHVVEGPFAVGEIMIRPFDQEHGRARTLGLRIGPLAYSTDASRLDEAAFAALAGVKVWIVDCLGPEPHPSHAHLALTLEWISRVRPQLAILTHMSHRLDYEELARELPPGVVPGHDGLSLRVSEDGVVLDHVPRREA